MHPIAARVQRIPPSATKEMPVIAARVGGCVSLGQGIPSFSTPEHIVDAVCRALREDPGSGKYSLQPGMPRLREAIAAQLQAEQGLSVDPGSELAVTVGAMEALLMATLTLVSPGDEVLLPAPYYPSHVEQVLLADGQPVPVPMGKGWTLDVEAMRRAVTPRTRAMILNSPHNPTGAVFNEADLRELAAMALEHGIYVICDDTYDYLSYDDPAFSMARIPELRPLLVGVNSFSKRYALTGWRVGYVLAPAELLAEMLKVHDCTAICAPTPAQFAALAALEGPQNIYAGFRDVLASRRDLLCQGLDALAPHVSYVRPAGAFYILARCHLEVADSRELAIRLIQEAKVITIPGGGFGPGGEGHLRLSYGGGEDEIREALRRLGEWLGRS